MLVENLRRNDLTELEEARGYQQLLDFGLSTTKPGAGFMAAYAARRQ
jgi:hypothetical protein